MRSLWRRLALQGRLPRWPPSSSEHPEGSCGPPAPAAEHGCTDSPGALVQAMIIADSVCSGRRRGI